MSESEFDGWEIQALMCHHSYRLKWKEECVPVQHGWYESSEEWEKRNCRCKDKKKCEKFCELNILSQPWNLFKLCKSSKGSKIIIIVQTFDTY